MYNINNLVYLVMEVIARIIPIEKKASDGSIFPRKVVVEYLESESYKNRMASRTCLGGVTHGNRDDKINKYSIVPSVDHMLINQNITHYVSRMWIDGDWLYGMLYVFPPEIFDGTPNAQWIRMLRGLLANNVEVPVSAVVVGEWHNNVCQKIKDIAGVDFTLDPGFEGAKVLLRQSNNKIQTYSNKNKNLYR